MHQERIAEQRRGEDEDEKGEKEMRTRRELREEEIRISVEWSNVEEKGVE